MKYGLKGAFGGGGMMLGWDEGFICGFFCGFTVLLESLGLTYSLLGVGAEIYSELSPSTLKLAIV